MAVTAVIPSLFPTELLRSGPPTASMRDAVPPAARVPDVVVFSSAPFRILAELATAGLQQLATLLPAIEHAVEDRSLVPLGHLAKAAGTAARQVADGHAALLAEGPERVMAALPGALAFRPTAMPDAALRALVRQVGTAIDAPPEARPNDDLRTAARQIGNTASALAVHTFDDPPSDPAQHWIGEAKELLRRTGDALATVQPDPALPLPQPSAWALSEIAAAQLAIAAATARLPSLAPSRSRTAIRLTFTLPDLRRLSSATSLFGIVLLMVVMALTSGAWSIVVGLIALAATAVWVWRIGRAARGLRLDARP